MRGRSAISACPTSPRRSSRWRARVVEVVSVQNSYSVGDREHEDLLAVCERDGLTFIPWYPLAEGEPVRNRIPRCLGVAGPNAAPRRARWPSPGCSALAAAAAHPRDHIARPISRRTPPPPTLALDDDEMALLDPLA